MGIYGGSNKNLFLLPSSANTGNLKDSKYNVQVNEQTQVAQVYRQGSLVAGGLLGQTGDNSLGTYNLKTKTFTPDANAVAFAKANPGLGYSEELKFFGSADGKKLITDKSATTVQKGVVDNGGNAKQAQDTALKVTGTNAATTGGATSEQISAAAGKETKGTRNEFPGANGSDPLRYPTNLKNDYQDVIKFNMVKYSPKKFSSTSFGFGSRDLAGSNKDRQIIGTVVLPIPAGISDQNAVNWAGQDMNALEAAGANLALSGIEGGGDKAAATAENIVKTVSGSSADVQKSLAAAMAGQATGVQGILSRTTGLINNPNMELLFQAPTLRPFNFTFKLSARSDKEAQTIRSIIRFFKQGMSPIRTDSNLFLKAPHTFQLQYLHKGKPHNYLNKFKECALQSFSVDYTPEGQYATFTDGAMVSYQITMQFQELEPVFNNDYGNAENASDTEIGY